MKKPIIFSLAGVALIVVFYFLPTPVTSPQKTTQEEKTHVAKISLKIAKRIQELRMKWSDDLRNEKNAIFADSLSQAYAQAKQYDSAAWFADKAATFFNTVKQIDRAIVYTDSASQTSNAEASKIWEEKLAFWLKKKLELNPSDDDAKARLAIMNVNAQPMVVVRELKEIVQRNPKNERSLYYLSMMSVQSQQWDKAVEWLNKLLTVNPNHEHGHVLLGMVLAQMGNKQDALQQFEWIKKQGKNQDYQKMADQYLNDLIK